jgi:hypothetical protein
MALAKGYNVQYRFQGISLHCWMTTLEMLMDWRHGSIYGIDPQTGNRRTQHTPEVLAAKEQRAPDQTPYLFGKWFKAGYSYDKVNGYGVVLPAGAVDGTAASWAKMLRAGGPILASGDYGPARIMGKHCVLVVGLSGTNKIVYLDPFLIGMKAIGRNHYTYASMGDMLKRLTVTLAGQSLYQAAPGGTDRGRGGSCFGGGDVRPWWRSVTYCGIILG